MAEEPMYAAGAAGGGSTDRRRAGDQNLEEFRKDLLAEVRRLDTESAKKLREKLDDNQRELLVAIKASADPILLELAQHNTWMVEREKEKAEADRLKREQAQRELWEAERIAKQKAARDARRKRWEPVRPFVYGTMATIAAGAVLYLLENLNTIHWDLQTQLIAALFIIMGIIIVLMSVL